jgi:hypothetical protein
VDSQVVVTTIIDNNGGIVAGWSLVQTLATDWSRIGKLEYDIPTTKQIIVRMF